VEPSKPAIISAAFFFVCRQPGKAMLPLFCALPTPFSTQHLQLSRQGALSPLRLGFEAGSHGLLDAFFEPSNRSPCEFSGHKRQVARLRRPIEMRGPEGCGILYPSLHKAWDFLKFAFWEFTLSRAQMFCCYDIQSAKKLLYGISVVMLKI
jgi:hypothetical protein